MVVADLTASVRFGLSLDGLSDGQLSMQPLTIESALLSAMARLKGL